MIQCSMLWTRGTISIKRPDKNCTWNRMRKASGIHRNVSHVHYEKKMVIVGPGHSLPMHGKCYIKCFSNVCIKYSVFVLTSMYRLPGTSSPCRPQGCNCHPLSYSDQSRWSLSHHSTIHCPAGCCLHSKKYHTHSITMTVTICLCLLCQRRWYQLLLLLLLLCLSFPVGGMGHNPNPHGSVLDHFGRGWWATTPTKLGHMLGSVSPDVLLFLQHHCNVDKWEFRHPIQCKEAASNSN